MSFCGKQILRKDDTQKVVEVRKSDLEGPQSQFRNYFSVRDSAIDQLSAILLNCGSKRLKLRMPSFQQTHLRKNVGNDAWGKGGGVALQDENMTFFFGAGVGRCCSCYLVARPLEAYL